MWSIIPQGPFHNLRISLSPLLLFAVQPRMTSWESRVWRWSSGQSRRSSMGVTKSIKKRNEKMQYIYLAFLANFQKTASIWFIIYIIIDYYPHPILKLIFSLSIYILYTIIAIVLQSLQYYGHYCNIIASIYLVLLMFVARLVEKWLLLLAKRIFSLTILWLLGTRPFLALSSRYFVVRFSFSFFTSDIRSPNLKKNQSKFVNNVFIKNQYYWYAKEVYTW